MKIPGLKKSSGRSGLWRLIHAIGITTVTILMVVVVLELAVPVQIDTQSVYPLAGPSVTPFGPDAAAVVSLQPVFSELATKTRSDLFKPATVLADKPMAEKTVERIKSQLKLQCIMRINGKAVAYINIKGTGLKRCKIGERIEDFFTVVDIGDKAVETTILGHKVTLSL
ncbi:MAG: hypothetical protein ACYSWP_01260 [Planctomycetota bacterium]|jgi:hypothetical protein